MNNKFTIPFFLSVVALSGALTALIALIYSLHLQGYVMHFPDYMNPRVKEFELLRCLLSGLGFIATILTIIFILKSTGDDEQLIETFTKWALISGSFFVLIAFIMFGIGVPEGKGEVINHSAHWFAVESLNDSAILDLSNVPTLAIAALWIVLFHVLVFFLMNSSVCVNDSESVKCLSASDNDACDLDCECADCLNKMDEEDLEDALDFIRSKDLYADFKEYQDLRNDERQNRREW